jgi:hypothetical protein
MNGKHEGIKTVVEFIQEIQEIQEIQKRVAKEKGQEQHIFYRGHSSERYRLIPSLFRKNSEGQFIYKDQEDILYRELYMSEYKEFIHDKYTLDKLVRMQHYSLPTRLLDLTTNPLIALYFACKSSRDKQESGTYKQESVAYKQESVAYKQESVAYKQESVAYKQESVTYKQESGTDNRESVGEVILFFINDEYVKYYDSDTASCIANLARLSHKEKKNIVFYEKNYKFEEELKEKFNQQFEIKKLLHFIKEEKSYFEPKINESDLKKIICIKGIRNNVRISSQSGVFLLFGLDAILDENGNKNIQIQRIKIRDQKKILDELDLLNINESTVFPDIESSARYISYKNKVK